MTLRNLAIVVCWLASTSCGGKASKNKKVEATSGASTTGSSFISVSSDCPVDAPPDGDDCGDVLKICSYGDLELPRFGGRF